MGQNFIADTVNQTLLFPPSLHDWLPEGHLARFLADVVAALDLSAIYTSYREKDGRWLAAAEKTDAEEDAQYGKDRHGDELAAEFERRESRLQKIGEVKAALEQEAKEKAAQQRAEAEQKLAERAEQERRTGKKKSGRKPVAPDPEQAKPDDTGQRNFTDPESRIPPDGANKGSFVQGYNAQIAVDSASQVIVAAEVTQETNDKKQLLPMIAQIAANLEQKPEKVSADAGYFSAANVTDE